MTTRSSSTRASSRSGRTQEYVEIPDDIVARIEGKSSLGRLGLIVHATAGFVDPGFKGTLTLEITNLTRVPIKLYTGHPDRAALVHDARRARRAPVRLARAGLALPGPDGRHGVPLRAGRPVGFRADARDADDVRRRGRRGGVRARRAFYILGGAAAVWAIVLFAIGMRSASVPGSAGAQRGVIAISVLVVARRDGQRRAHRLTARRCHSAGMATEEQSTNGGGVATASDTLTVTDNRTGKTYEIPIEDGTIRAPALREIKVVRRRLRPDDLRPGVHEHRVVPLGDHLPGRRQRRARVPRLPDRAARRAVDLPRGRLPADPRRAARRRRSWTSGRTR